MIHDAEIDGHLSAALSLVNDNLVKIPPSMLPWHQASSDFELAKLALGLLSSPASQPALDSSEIAHTPLRLSPLAKPRSYAYAVHQTDHPNVEARPPITTRLLLYRRKDRSVNILTLLEADYSVALALELSSLNRVPLTATELLLELAELRDIDNVVQFVEQGLKILTRLNDLGLLLRATTEEKAKREAFDHNT